MKKNNKILYISIAVLVLAVGILFGTYSYYQTTISGTITGTVAIGYNWPYNLVSDDDQTLQGYIDGQNVSLWVTIIARQVDISSNEAVIISAFTTDLLRLRNNSSCTTNNDYGYLCDWKYMDHFYAVAVEEGLIEINLEAVLVSFHPDFLDTIVLFEFES